jgi:hypothetical protein
LTKRFLMRLAPLISRLLTPLVVLCIFACSFPGCSKNGPGPHNSSDSTDTVLHRNAYDSAKFFLTFDLTIVGTSGVFSDTFWDHASMIVYVVNGAVKVPHDSIRNIAPIVYPKSGSSGSWSATWIQDQIGEINITDAIGLVLDDTTVALTFTQTACVTPNWNITFMGGAPSPTGNNPSPGWPLALLFNPKLQSQYPNNLVQPGSQWVVWCYKDY